MEPILVDTPGGTWPVNPYACNPDFDDLDPAIIEYVTTAAGLWLYRLTGRRFGTDDISIRPCRQDCDSFVSTYRRGVTTHRLHSSLFLAGSSIYGRSSYACSGCFCNNPSLLLLPATPATAVTNITVDGESIDLAGFQLLDQRTLAAPPSFSFPRCQDISLPPTEEGTWEVTYTYGTPVPADGAYAAGFLANELAKACSGTPCALPRRVQSIARQGLNIQIVDNPDFLRDGIVGLTEVDQFIVSVNPYGIHSRPRVHTPETISTTPKRVTWTPTP